MRKSLSVFLLLALLVGLAGFCPARAVAEDDVQIVAVMACAGVDALADDLAIVADYTDNPTGVRMAAAAAKAFFSKNVSGLDGSRPWVVLLGTDGEDIGGCLAIPVSDFDKAIKGLKAKAKDKLTETKGGVFALKTPKKTVYIKQNSPGWAIVVDDPAIFPYVPADPTEPLDGLHKQYDLAVRLTPANLPQKIRACLKEKIQKCAAKHAHGHHGRCKPDENMVKAHRIIHAHIQRQVLACLGDLEEVTLGYRFCAKGKKSQFEVSVVAKPGTRTARELAAAKTTKTAFGGFVLPDAVLSARGTGQHRPLPPKQLDQVIDAVRASKQAKIDRHVKNTDDAAAAKALLDGLLEVAKKTGASGRGDGAVSLRLTPDACTLLTGRAVVDGSAVDKALKQFVEDLRPRHAKGIDKFLTLDAEKVGPFTLHVASIPIGPCPHRDKTIQAVGEKIELVLAISPKAVCFAAGRDAVTTLKKAMACSKKSAGATVNPAEVTLDVGQLVAIAQACPKAGEKAKAKAARAAEIIEPAGDADRVLLAIEPIERGITFRLELEEGVIRLIGHGKELR